MIKKKKVQKQDIISIKDQLADLLRNTRMQENLSQTELSNISGVMQGTISKIENKNSKIFASIETIEKLFLSMKHKIIIMEKKI